MKKSTATFSDLNIVFMELFKAYLEASGREKQNELYPKLLSAYTDICKAFADSIVMFNNARQLLKAHSEQIPGDIPQWKRSAVAIFGYNLVEKHEKMLEVLTKWETVCEINKKNNPS